jgi:imipenem/basic amino acid-specific outer membrane pore
MNQRGIPGLVLSTAHIRGGQIHVSQVDPKGGYAYLEYGRGGKHCERDLEACHVIWKGKAKGTALSLWRNLSRGNTAQAKLDGEQLCLAVE